MKFRIDLGLNVESDHELPSEVIPVIEKALLIAWKDLDESTEIEITSLRIVKGA